MSKIKLEYDLKLEGKNVTLVIKKSSGFKRGCGRIALYSDLKLDIRSAAAPQLTHDTIYLRGGDKDYDKEPSTICCPTLAQAEDYYKRVRKALERLTGKGQWVCEPIYRKLNSGANKANKELG